MKSVLSLLLCMVTVVSLSACTVGKERFLLPQSNTVSFDLSGITVKGELVSKGQDDITFVLSEPENLRDISFSKTEIKSQDVKIPYPDVKDESPVYILLSVVADLSEKEIFLPDKGKFHFNGSVPPKEYKVTFDCEKKKIISIDTEKCKYIFE